MNTIEFVQGAGGHWGADGFVYVDRVDSVMHRPHPHAAGRTCRAPGCHTILSIYNPGSHCSVHESGLEPPVAYRVHRTHRASAA